MEAFALIALVVWAFAVGVLGGVVGLVLGNLRLPLGIDWELFAVGVRRRRDNLVR